MAVLSETGGNHWQPVLALQDRLEAEARKIRRKLRHESSTGPIPLSAKKGTSQAYRFASEQMGHRAGREQTLVITLPAPTVPLETLLHLDPQETAFLWNPPDGTACVALGTALELRATGVGRTKALRRAAQQAGEFLDTVEHPAACSTPSPRFYGGLAFSPGAADQAPWDGLGDARFVLPRFLYRRNDQGATISLAVCQGEMRSAADRDTWAAALEHRLRALAAMGPTKAVPHSPGLRIQDLSERRQWLESVTSLVDEIKAGDLEKLVIGRSALVELQTPADPVEILRRLGENSGRSSNPDADGTTRFAIRYGTSTFLGATPERLIARHGCHVQTAALAGSIARSSDAAERLLANPKELHEHRLVAETIASRLRPLCSSLDVASGPRIRELRHLLHLETPIHGLLRKGLHVLELVDHLHPTPAVGGLPASDVLHHLERFETVKRGWYASPVGWFDSAGNGDFAVALRCGVLRDRQAHLFAGAGIVADSKPRLELAETELKLHTLREALEV
jgi:menaquinone-specific isochorismate synthase